MNNSERVEHTFFKKKSSKRNMYRDVFSLRISEEEKYANDGEFFKNYLKYVVPSNTTRLTNFERLKAAYEILNNDLSRFRDKVDLFCDPLGEVMESFGKLENDIQSRPVLRNKINVLTGEYLKRNDRHKIIMLSAHAIREKDKLFIEELKKAVDHELMTEIEAMQKQMEGASEEELNQFVEKKRQELSIDKVQGKEFKTSTEIFYENALRFAERDQMLKTKKHDTLIDELVSDMFFVHSGWKHGKPHLEIRNPLFTGFLKDPNEKFVHKSDYIFYHKPITLSQALDNYPHLSEDEIDRLLTTAAATSKDKRHDVMGGSAEPIFESLNLKEGKLYEDVTDPDNPTLTMFPETKIDSAYNKLTGMAQDSGNLSKRLRALIWETHFEFKAYRKVIFLSYLDQDNDRVTVMLPDSFKIPKRAEREIFLNKWQTKAERFTWTSGSTEYTAEELWIPRKYEVVRLGQDVFPYYGEVPFQFTDLDQPYSNFNLSTFGLIMNARNANSLSLLQGAIPAFFQYLYVKEVQNRELAKYEGYIQDVDVDQIPKELGLDADGNVLRDPVATWFAVRKKTGVNFYSGSQTTGNRPAPSTRSPGSMAKVIGTAADIFSLQQLAQLLEQEIGFAMGISPQREAMFTSNTNVSDNQQAIMQSSNITEPFFYFHSVVWSDILNDYLKNFRTWQQRYFDEFPEEKDNILHYLGPDGKAELFRITPDMLGPTNIGVYAETTSNDQKYYEYMLQQLQPISQNAGEGAVIVSTILKSIFSNTSPEEVHELIQKEVGKQQARMQEAQMAQEQARIKAEQERLKQEIANREDIQEHEKEKIILEKTLDRRVGADKIDADRENALLEAETNRNVGE